MSETEDGQPRGGGGARGARLAWLCWWVALSVLWLALTDSRRAEEIVTGVVVGALGASAAVLVRSERAAVLRPRPRWALATLAPLREWPRDLVALAWALVRRPRGRIVEEPFAATGDDSRDAARQALAEVGGSLAPNRIVIGVDADRGVIVSHVLVDEQRRR